MNEFRFYLSNPLDGLILGFLPNALRSHAMRGIFGNELCGLIIAVCT
ncbi:hypothetical protein [Nostoc sp.]